MLLPRGRLQQLYLLHTTSNACTEQSWTDFSHEKGVLGGTGLSEAADSTVMWNWYLNQELGSHQLEPCRSPRAACITSEPQSQSTCFEGTSDLETCLLTARCVSAPTPKLGLSQHIHPSLCLLSNACGSSFKACSVDRNAKGCGTLLCDQLWVLLPACTASLRSPSWAQQQEVIEVTLRDAYLVQTLPGMSLSVGVGNSSKSHIIAPWLLGCF